MPVQEAETTYSFERITPASNPDEFDRLRRNLDSKMLKRSQAADKKGISLEKHCLKLDGEEGYKELNQRMFHFGAGSYKGCGKFDQQQSEAQEKPKVSARKMNTSRSTYKKSKIPSQEAISNVMENVDFEVTDMSQVMQKLDKFKAIKSNTIFDRLISIEGGWKGGTTYIAPGEAGAGKTSVLTQYLVNLIRNNPEMRDEIGFHSAEMQVMDWREECEHNKSLSILPIVFMKKALREVQDVEFLAILKKMFKRFKYSVIDSFEVIKSKITENTNLSSKDAENWLLSTFEDLNEEGHAFFVIQHMNKSGEYTGSTRIKHDPTGMMTVRFDNEGERYIEWTKNRRNGAYCHKPLYFVKNSESGEINWDERRFLLSEQSSNFNKSEGEKIEEDEDWLRTAFKTSVVQEKKEDQKDTPQHEGSDESTDDNEIDEETLNRLSSAARMVG